MKRLLALVVMSLGLFALASGKISAQGSYYPSLHKTTPSFGLSIYESLFWGVSYNGWTGFGWQPRLSESAVLWAVSRHDLERWWGKLGVAAGFTIRHADQEGLELSSHPDVHLKVQYQLW